MHEGYYSTLLGMRGIPAASEETMVARDVILARLTGAHVHIAHLSTAGAVEAVRRAKAEGVRVTCEVTPHHIALTDEAVQSFSTNLKMNPPLRSEDHRLALLDGIADGTVDAIATDHAPHHFDEKNVEFDLAPMGITGLETAFAVCYQQLVRSKVISLSRLIEMLTSGPAGVFNLPGGHVAAGQSRGRDPDRSRGRASRRPALPLQGREHAVSGSDAAGEHRDDDRRRRGEARHPRETAAATEAQMTEQKPKRIVIVDDSPVVLRSLVELHARALRRDAQRRDLHPSLRRPAQDRRHDRPAHRRPGNAGHGRKEVRRLRPGQGPLLRAGSS